MKNTISNTQILKKLISFALPLILSGMLQQLFNWVDALIVGNIIGEKALALPAGGICNQVQMENRKIILNLIP